MIENYEGIAYCFYHAYMQKTGREIARGDDIAYGHTGKGFKELESLLRYPELALLAW